MEDPFQPTWSRALLAAGLAALGFALPQKVPLEYRPLNDPSQGLQYLEVTCAADSPGTVEILLDTGRGFNPVDAIRWPVAPSETAYTYTFPLADAPLAGLRLVPFKGGSGTLVIRGFRIIDRVGREIHRFSGSDFRPTHQIAAVSPVAGGWEIATLPDATEPYSDVRLGRPLVAEGMGLRNLQRCLLSWSYLSLMIWILLLAVYAALRCASGFRGALRACAFLALAALLFAAVGNRGLIRNSIRDSYSAFLFSPR
jgi:hypothetical protein